MYVNLKYAAACCFQAAFVATLMAGSSALRALPNAYTVAEPGNGAYVGTSLNGADPIAESGGVSGGVGSTSATPELPAVALGAHTLYWQGEGTGFSPAVTDPINTQTSGSSLLVLRSSYTSNSAVPTDNKSNPWTQVGDAVVYRGYPAFSAAAYVSLAARGGPEHTVSVVKQGMPHGEITIPFIEIRNAGVLQDVAQNYPASGPTVTSGSVTTTGPATLIAVWWGDGGVKLMTAVPNNGFAVIDSFLHLPDNSGTQCAVAMRSVAGAGTYNVTWTAAPQQGAILWLFAFQSQSRIDGVFGNGFD